MSGTHNEGRRLQDPEQRGIFADGAPGRWPPRFLVGVAAAAVLGLAAVAAVDVRALAGFASGARWAPRTGALWMCVLPFAAVAFLCWFMTARHNALRYGPVGKPVDAGGTVVIWLVPVANAVLAWVVLLDVLEGTHAEPGRARPRRPRTGLVLIGTWSVLWAAMCTALVLAVAANFDADAARAGNTSAVVAWNSAFHALSLAAAAVMAVFIGRITRTQCARAADPVHAPVREAADKPEKTAGQHAVGAVGTALAVTVPLAVLGLTVSLFGLVTFVIGNPTDRAWGPPRHLLSHEELARTWADEDTRIVLAPDGSAVVEDLDGRYSGRGTWTLTDDGRTVAVRLDPGGGRAEPETIDLAADRSRERPKLVHVHPDGIFTTEHSLHPDPPR
ncbi:DUF4328 domain-containing protein [Yinghuangia soli]|uniref:DUF4328 domain-containing protein n=1 Tax=Yinghuangia soli TaxID=2908204 RepID=A0AA41Q0T4_9ACTN|nr:DUF4328 domain-containing protein [Yinghuangia soli]MCF2529465.1 DUF4328 domain-containing protein [Yinghuangia soli]